jgi:hypothetical protein
MTVSRIAVAFTLAALSACGGSRSVSQSGSTGGSQYTRQVQGYLDRLKANVAQSGYTRHDAGPVFVSLNDNATNSLEMTVVGGTSYFIFGACDYDCHDVDIKIFDTRGNLLMQDVLVDDQPIVRFTANGSGKYRVDVVMATCNANPCRYGVKLMAR